MNNKLFNKLVNKSLKFFEMPQGRSKHFSFILDGNKPLSFGWNQMNKTHPWTIKYGYKFGYIHSELDVIINYLKSYSIHDLRKYTLVNVRLGLRKDIRISKPCLTCMKTLAAFGIYNVWFTTDSGELIKL